MVVEELYGCFSPYGSPPLSQPFVSVGSVDEGMDGILAPMLQIAPESHELCEESSVVLPLEPSSSEVLAVCGKSSVVLLLELGSSEAVTVASTPSPHKLLDSVVTGDGSADNADAFFAAKLYDLLASLEAVSPGYGKDIVRVLAEKASEDLIRKVEKSLRRGRSRKRGVARKTLRATRVLDLSMVGWLWTFASWCSKCCEFAQVL
jgi:hypothetical protein